MEEKKVLNEEKTEEVSGGRVLCEREFTGLDLTDKEAFLEGVKKLKPKSGEIPKELLDTVSGGSVYEGELDDWDMNYLDGCITFYKNHDMDLESMLGNMLNSGLSNEALWYVGTHW